jgi:hypothetical protein
MKIDTDDSGWSQYVIIDIEKDDSHSDNANGRTLEIVRNKLQVKKQKRELYSMNQHDKYNVPSGIIVYSISVFCLVSLYIGFLIYN